jgi:hypothetical protein
MGTARRARGLGVIGAALATGAVHCSLTTSLEGFSSGARAGDDASVPDSGTIAIDASSDVAPGKDASDTRRWCERLSPAAKFCDDFDDTVSPTAWDKTLVDPGTTLTRDTIDARSSPRALFITTSGSAKQECLLQKNLPVALLKKVHIAFDMKVDQFGNYSELAYIHVFAAQADSALLVRVRNPEASVVLTSQSFATSPATTHDVDVVPSSTFATWKRVDLDFDLDAHSARMQLEGVQVASIALEPTLYVSGTATVGVGYEYVPSDDKRWATRFDNVTIDWE